MFQLGMALSKNTASLLVFRFLGGTFEYIIQHDLQTNQLKKKESSQLRR
jgi:hypothetical protein